jgi:hypothetical protein
MTAERADVMERARGRNRVRLVTPRRLVLALAVLASALVPLTALGAANDWWFLRFGGAIPVPATAPQVVKEGEWNGHPWQLIAYPSAAHGLCISITPKGSSGTGEGGALSCGPFVGVARTPERPALPDMTITFLAGGGSENLPAYVAGPVVEEASAVEIRLGDGDVLRVPTFAGSEPLEHVRFYAAPLPTDISLTPGSAAAFLRWVAGLDASGSVVACLAPHTAEDGISSLADCR